MGKLQIGCFIITVFIMILHFSVKRISTRSHKVYSALLIVSVLYLIFSCKSGSMHLSDIQICIAYDFSRTSDTERLLRASDPVNHSGGRTSSVLSDN